MSRITRPLWQCTQCGRAFANRNQSHTCASLELDHHFVGKSHEVRLLYQELLEHIRAFGPVTVLPEKSRIAFQVRISFAQVTPRKGYLVGHLVLARVSSSTLFTKVETISKRNHVHHFKVTSTKDLNREFLAHLEEAYRVGQQLHLST